MRKNKILKEREKIRLERGHGERRLVGGGVGYVEGWANKIIT